MLAAVSAAAAIVLLGTGLWPGGGRLTIRYPLDETLFPPDIVAPTLRWEDTREACDAWRIRIDFRDGGAAMEFRSRRREWTPEPRQWELIKERSVKEAAAVTIQGFRRSEPDEPLTGDSVSIRTSTDEVGAPLFYREVNLPFVEAVKDPSRIRWRFGAVCSPQPPPVVLEKLPVCGNCHSFTRDGATLAMDVDYANSKGSYVITRVARDMVLATSDIITWNDYRKEDGEQTFGLLSQVSPDGKFVISTVKDKSVFVPMPKLAFSQLFFPVKGILAVYRRDTGAFYPLPGADDPKYVQSNPCWSPDGKTVVFARTEAYDLRHTKGKGKVLLTREECREFTEDGKPFKFNLYRVPFNDGLGGEARPIEGASHDGMSNYFPKYSPDGKWIVFCKAGNYMLLQGDSQLYIIPAEGGEARRLRCNTALMNSWHSFSPNGKWLVFASKANTPYTQLFLTHIDEQGRSTPPVLLSHFTAPDRAANIPEFVNADRSAIVRIQEKFLDDYSFVRAGNQFFRAGEADPAIKEYRKALRLNPNSAEAHLKLGFLLYNVKARHAEGMAHLSEALRLSPGDPRVHYDIGMAMMHQRKLDDAIRHLSEAVRGAPNGIDNQYNAVDMRSNLARALLLKGDARGAGALLAQAADLAPDNAAIHYRLAVALAAQGQIDEPLGHYTKAVGLDPKIDRSTSLHQFLAANYARAGRFDEAVACANRALAMARAAGKTDLARRIEGQIQLYKQNSPSPRPGGP
ncbi:MAG: tetratricopeptide repeat protein [Phycisphaerae bacterium]